MANPPAPGALPALEELGKEEPELQPSAPISVTAPDGTSGTIPLEDYGKAIKAGYVVDPAEKEKAEKAFYGNRPIAATLAGAARGLTAGLSDPLAVKTGIAAPETLRGLKEQNPGLSVGSELAGAAGSLLIPGLGEASAAKATMAAGKAAVRAVGLEAAESVGGRLLGKAVAGGVEGALWNAGSAVSEDAIGESKLNAQMLISHMGMGALIGSGGGAIGGVLDEAIGLGAKQAAKHTGALADDLEVGLYKKADEYALKATGGIQSDIAKLTNPDRRALAKLLREQGLIGSGPEQTFGNVAKALLERTKALGEELNVKSLKTGELHAGSTGDEVAEVLSSERKALGETAIGGTLEAADASGAKFDWDGPIEKIQKLRNELNPAEERIAGPALTQLQEDMAKSAEAGAGFAAANDLKATHYEAINWAAESKAKNNLLKQAAHELNEEIETQLKKSVSEGAYDSFTKAKKAYGLLSETERLADKGKGGKQLVLAMLEKSGASTQTAEEVRLLSMAHDMGQKGLNRMQGNRTVSLTDYLLGGAMGVAGAVAHGTLPGMALGVAGALGNKVLRHAGPAAIAKTAELIAGSPALRVVANSFARAIDRAAKQAPNLLGQYAPILLSAAAQGSPTLLATHLAIAPVDHQYRQSMALIGIHGGGPGKEAEDLERAHGLSVIHEAISTHASELGRHVERAMKGGGEHKPSSNVLGSQDFGSRRARAKSAEAAHGRHVEQLAELAANPEALMERIGARLGPLGRHAPVIAAAAAETATRAVSFLKSKLGKPPPTGPLAPEWRPSGHEISVSNRYLQTVLEPKSALQHVSSGTLTPEHVETLKAVYPELLQKMTEHVTERLLHSPKVPQTQRLMIRMLTGVDVDGQFQQQAIANNQLAYGKPSEKSGDDAVAQSPMSPASQGHPSAGKVTLASRFRLPSAAAEARRDA